MMSVKCYKNVKTGKSFAVNFQEFQRKNLNPMAQDGEIKIKRVHFLKTVSLQ